MSNVEAAIKNACEATLGKPPKGIVLRPAETNDIPSMLDLLSSSDKAIQPRHGDSSSDKPKMNVIPEACRLEGVPNFYGLVVIKDATVVGFATFYMAYSTWDATVLYLDKLFLLKDSSDRQALEWSLQFTLADIALRLGCARYTWQHFAPCPKYPSDTQPEVLDGWLTLYWNYDTTTYNKLNHAASWTAESDRNAINQCLREKQQSNSSDLHIRLSTVDDLDHIERLVQGLAEFEKEPESVHVTKEHYRRDGFGQQSPLFHCLLLEDHSSSPPYVCGMAFTYFGHSFGQGRFLYLEDLYMEEPYRGKGGGTMVMQTLQDIAQSTDCVRAVWQALDWNTPALTFYNKIGAAVQEGLITSRFAGESLQKFYKERKDY
ncbi:Diamine acetyltransferase 2 [Seminavis robusta]|uniref:Diamine acetyltransferase 2 n=1 Tax=Seminavis robusta TaxID=568900 RepID=A0A9N8E713_9STRA|nr:Diamine acetyltransferase 2 [Seminavis robusta]|eukprot:Sro746_g196440.1 Diamine acetyltransferase 2 (375) ;mRNA; r:30632-31879